MLANSCKQNRFYQNHIYVTDNTEGCMLACLATDDIVNAVRYQQLAIDNGAHVIQIS
jgi:hypothetical protein